MTDVESKHDWERPGAFEVAPGVHRIPLPLPNDGLHAVNVYAVADGEQVVMIDAGWALDSSRRQLESSLGSIGYDLSSISRFLVTHVHRDHYTQAITIRRVFGSRVLLGIEERHTLSELLSTAQHLPKALLDRLRAGGAASLVDELVRAESVTDPVDLREWGEPDEWISDGMAIQVGGRTLSVLATPGHTRGHVVFHDAQARLLFAGDHVLPHITPSIGFESAPAASALSHYLASLRTVAALADSTLLPAHGPIGESTAGRVSQLLSHHQHRLAATLVAVSEGAATGYDVAQTLRWTSRQRRFSELDLFNQMIAVNETIAHLEVLVEQQKLAVSEVAGVDIYRN
jgi:glyoxylase-like metal-dependent hydrolase (beta-lactamase superfamily II)